MKTNDESLKDIEITTKNLDYLGIVAGAFDELGISEVLDEKLPKNRQHKCSHSTIVKAMVLNGLGYTERRLYLFPSYFNNLPTERLLGRGILPEDINEDTVGRTLDRIYEYGSTKLFSVKNVIIEYDTYGMWDKWAIILVRRKGVKEDKNGKKNKIAINIWEAIYKTL